MYTKKIHGNGLQVELDSWIQLSNILIYPIWYQRNKTNPIQVIIFNFFKINYTNYTCPFILLMNLILYYKTMFS